MLLKDHWIKHASDYNLIISLEKQKNIEANTVFTPSIPLCARLFFEHRGWKLLKYKTLFLFAYFRCQLSGVHSCLWATKRKNTHYSQSCINIFIVCMMEFSLQVINRSPKINYQQTSGCCTFVFLLLNE